MPEPDKGSIPIETVGAMKTWLDDNLGDHVPLKLCVIIDGYRYVMPIYEDDFVDEGNTGEVFLWVEITP